MLYGFGASVFVAFKWVKSKKNVQCLTWHSASSHKELIITMIMILTRWTPRTWKGKRPHCIMQHRQPVNLRWIYFFCMGETHRTQTLEKRWWCWMLIKMDIIVKNVCCICNDTNKMLVNLASDTLVSKIFFSLTRLPMWSGEIFPALTWPEWTRWAEESWSRTWWYLILIDHILISWSFDIL